jgi:tetratricopeptide (TPR) repeat protein
LRGLDAGLRNLTGSDLLVKVEGLSLSVFAIDDPFRQRPAAARARTKRIEDIGFDALHASGAATILKERLLESTRGSESLAATLAELRLEEPSQRFALLYALQESGRGIAENPLQALAFANAVLQLQKPRLPADDAAERMIPSETIQAQAHVLAAQANLWSKDFDTARAHLVVAYHGFARGGGDATDFAIVELTESQRRSFLGEGSQALALAQRAYRTFEEQGLDDLAARATVAMGLAWVALGDLIQAAEAYRQALPIFEQFELWSNYVGAVNSLATALYRLGRLDEARREFARALRKFSREKHKSILGFLRHGLGEILFAAGRFREAAISLGQASICYDECGLRASALIATLGEAESWARQGNLDRARARLDLVQRHVRDDPSLDPSVQRIIAAAIANSITHSEEFASLRRDIEGLLLSSSPRNGAR